MLRQGRFTVALTVCVVVMFGFSPAAHADFTASATDPVGDSADPSPARDITAAGLTYDRKAGSLSGFVRFARYPGDAPSFIGLFAGIRTGSGCSGLPAGGFGSYSDEYDAGWYRLDPPDGGISAKGEADKTGIDSKVQEFEVKTRALAGKRWNCVIASVTETGGSMTEYDTTGSIPLVGRPGLALNIRGPKKLRRNRNQMLRFKVSNPGDGAARNVKLRLGHARGMRLSKYSKSLGTIGAGKRRKFRIRIRFNDRARALTKVTLRGSSGALRLKGTLKLHVQTKRRKPKGGDSGGSGSSQLCTRYSPDLSGETGGSLILVFC